MKNNLKLPQTKQQMLRADAEINVDKEAVAQTVVPTVVIREPTTTEDVSAIPVEPTTITGVQQIKGKIPLSTAPPKPAKQQKIVKFAKGIKEEQGRKGVGSRHETEQRATANAAGLPSSASLVPTQAERCQLQIPVYQLKCQLVRGSQSKLAELLRKTQLQPQAPR